MCEQGIDANMGAGYMRGQNNTSQLPVRTMSTGNLASDLPRFSSGRRHSIHRTIFQKMPKQKQDDQGDPLFWKPSSWEKPRSTQTVDSFFAVICCQRLAPTIFPIIGHHGHAGDASNYCSLGQQIPHPASWNGKIAD